MGFDRSVLYLVLRERLLSVGPKGVPALLVIVVTVAVLSAVFGRDEAPWWLVASTERVIAARYDKPPEEIDYLRDPNVGWVVFARFPRAVDCCSFFATRIDPHRRTTAIGLHFVPEPPELRAINERCASIEGCRNAFWTGRGVG